MKVCTLFCPLLLSTLVLSLSACSKSADESGPAGPAEHAQVKLDKSATSGHQGEEGKHAEEEASESGIRMDEAALAAAGVQSQTLRPSLLTEELRAPGEVIDNAYGTTLITPRVEALVVRRHARIGDEVEAGAALVTLSSVEVANAQADLRIAEEEWRRVSALGREAVSGRRIKEAQVAVDRARAAARAYGLPGAAAGRSNGEFTLTAPHAGRLTEDDFVVGQRIEPGKPLFRLVDESTVWVDAKLPSDAVSRVQAGAPATVIAGGQRMPGTVMHSAHRTSEATRNASVRVEVPNPDDRLHGGDYVDVYFEAGRLASAQSQTSDSLSVPNGALVQIEGETVVFRRDEHGAFAPVPVRVGDVIGDHTVIREGLKTGDTVVVTGAFTLKSQILKAQMGEGHGH
ncbi:MAG: efflux RND transporter periplasmic adaptor subunit [Dokdonella sp.]|uniref:efflux RND transporter periplasmic adaptor subunit n=1 Tax=Dokdonella sp. TaxID=2291710 RepID=UPI0025C3D27B|nr:efflux RND transporter periplasmic adaptor subunit [Dokdonella sp.]MBK8122199.1 efflux RND transporter periplasmic adaptor subunit [Dokdonella sp.]